MKLATLVTPFLVTAALAGDCPTCPTPPKLSCDALLNKASQRCSRNAIDNFCECPAVVASSPCPVCPACPEAPAKVEHVYEFIDSPAPTVKDTVVVGLGPVFMHATGATLMAGYTHTRSGFGVQAQVLYIPQPSVAPYTGEVTYRCHEIPFVVPGVDERRPFGGAVLATYTFPVR